MNLDKELHTLLWIPIVLVNVNSLSFAFVTFMDNVFHIQSLSSQESIFRKRLVSCVCVSMGRVEGSDIICVSVITHKN